MARVIRGAHNHLQDELADLKKRRRLTGIFGLLGVLLFLGGPALARPTLSLLGLVIALVSYMGTRKIHTAIEVVQAGLLGEESAEAIFRELPSTYTVYSDLTIESDGRSSQIDHVVVGPTGIFVIETKNLNGEIHGNAEDHEWKQTKTGRQGGTYENTFYNPTKQVGTHVYRLSSILKATHIHTWVQGVVYFSNPDAIVHTDSTKIPVFSCSADGAFEMKNYIMNYSGGGVVDEKRSKIDGVLKQVLMAQGE